MSVRDTLKKSRPKVHSVEISSGPVFVRSLSGAGRQRYSELSKAHDGTLGAHTIAALGLCEESGAMCFSMDSEKEVALANLELQEMDGADLQAICLKLFEISGLGDKANEKAEKKSEASQSA